MSHLKLHKIVTFSLIITILVFIPSSFMSMKSFGIVTYGSGSLIVLCSLIFKFKKLSTSKVDQLLILEIFTLMIVMIISCILLYQAVMHVEPILGSHYHAITLI